MCGHSVAVFFRNNLKSHIYPTSMTKSLLILHFRTLPSYWSSYPYEIFEGAVSD